MKGLLVYERADAAQNAGFIRHAMAAAQARELELRLAFCGEPEPAAFAVMRARDPALSQRLEREGVRCFNSAAFSAMANDKLNTYALLRDIVPMLPTFPAEVLPKSFPVVVKPRRGHGGKNVALARDAAAYAAAVEACLPDAAIWQPFADPGADLRVYVIGGEPLCGMLRENPRDFRSNYKLGGSARRVELTAAVRDIVSAVCEPFCPDYAGIDIIWKDGAPVLNEVEDVVGARMLYENTGLDPVELYFDHIAKAMKRKGT